MSFFILNPLSLTVTATFSILKFYILLTQRICMFCVEFRTNSDYFPIEYYLTYIYIYVEDAAERTPQFWRIVASGGERVQWWGATIEQRCTCRFHC